MRDLVGPIKGGVLINKLNTSLTSSFGGQNGESGPSAHNHLSIFKRTTLPCYWVLVLPMVDWPTEQVNEAIYNKGTIRVCLSHWWQRCSINAAPKSGWPRTWIQTPRSS